MIRTPTKTADAGEVSQAGASQACRVSTSPIRSVRRSVGEWEGQTKKPRTSPRSVVPAVKEKARALPKAVEPTPAPAAAGQSPKGDKPASADRIKEARACPTKAKLHLGSSRNLKTEIKEQVLLAINRLYELYKEAELAHRERTRDPKKGPVEEPASAANRVEVEAKNPPANPPPVSHSELLNKLDSHARLLEANTKELEGLRESLAAVKVQEKVKPPGTYASVTAGPAKRPPPGCEPKHSVAVSSGTDTGEQVLGKIRKALNATQTGIRVDRIRRVRDGRVILGCGTEAELERMREGLRRADKEAAQTAFRPPAARASHVTPRCRAARAPRLHHPSRTAAKTSAPKMYRTPTKTADAGEVSQAGASQPSRVSTSPIRSVRRSVGEWEGQGKKPRTSPRSVVPAVKVKARTLPKAVEPTPAPAAAGQSPKGDKPASADRIKEARACLTKAKLHLGSSRNLKTEIKEQVLLAINRLYELYKEAELAHRERTRDPIKGPVEEPASVANRVEVEAKNPPANPPPA
ncbi:uncharacterized protein [Battus philenor]|uniref:uncharacterized protein n=1 Tax=Battus philenor TaxID=42288 RepID=UPI0035D0AD73